MVLAAAQRYKDRSRRLAAAEALVQRLDQHAVRTEVEEQIKPGGDQRVGGGGELDRFAEVTAPVLGVELFAFEAGAGDGRVERHGGSLRPDSGKCGDELTAERVHLRTVECDLAAEQAVENVL